MNVITLAVDDLERSLAFYRDGLGFRSDGIIGIEWSDERTGANGAVALFELDNGLILSLYPRRDLALDAEIELRPAQQREFSLGQLVQSRGRLPHKCKPARVRHARRVGKKVLLQQVGEQRSPVQQLMAARRSRPVRHAR